MRINDTNESHSVSIQCDIDNMWHLWQRELGEFNAAAAALNSPN